MNELTLCIVNEGADYQERLRIARLSDRELRIRRWQRRVQEEVDKQRQQFDADFTVGEEWQACQELDEYYQEHIAEIDRCERERSDHA